jgi:hypothetical protein
MKKLFCVFLVAIFFLVGCSDAMFFPAEKAKTDGNSVTYMEWLNFSGKKQRIYVEEYVTHVGLNLEKEFTTKEIVASLNDFAEYCDETCVASPMTKILSTLTVTYTLKADKP